MTKLMSTSSKLTSCRILALTLVPGRLVVSPEQGLAPRSAARVHLFINLQFDTEGTHTTGCVRVSLRAFVPALHELCLAATEEKYSCTMLTRTAKKTPGARQMGTRTSNKAL